MSALPLTDVWITRPARARVTRGRLADHPSFLLLLSR
jgi:hypothetical protein